MKPIQAMLSTSYYSRRVIVSTISPVFGCTPPVHQKWRQNFATATRTKNNVEIKEAVPPSSSPVSSIMKPSISTFFSDVDDMFDKNPFFSSPRTHDLMSHFWRQIDWLDEMRKKRLLSSMYLPSYDIHTDGDKVQVVLDIPGVSLSDIDVSVENEKLLHISGRRKIESKDGEVVEIKFDKQFNFGQDLIDTSKIIANLANGVLRVTLPKLPSAHSTDKVKKIDVIDGSVDPEC